MSANQQLVLYVTFLRCAFVQHNTIEAVLQRGEKLDDLVDKSEGLSLQSKAFYKTVSVITMSADRVRLRCISMRCL